MASMTMAAPSLLPNSVTNLTNNGSLGRRSGVVVVAKASRGVAAAGGERVASLEMKRNEERNNGRRELMFVGAAIAAGSIAKAVMAEEEPIPGTPEAKKKYAPICVTMPTAKICHK